MILFVFHIPILGLVPPDSHHEVMSHIANRGFPLLSKNKHLTLLTPQYYEEWLIDFDQRFQSSFVKSLKSLGLMALSLGK